MTSFSAVGRGPAMAAASTPAAQIARRKPQRVTITISWATHQRLVERSGYEGRSFSNLAAHILELGSDPIT